MSISYYLFLPEAGVVFAVVVTVGIVPIRLLHKSVSLQTHSCTIMPASVWISRQPRKASLSTQNRSHSSPICPFGTMANELFSS